jgi:hypothetical protein
MKKLAKTAQGSSASAPGWIRAKWIGSPFPDNWGWIGHEHAGNTFGFRTIRKGESLMLYTILGILLVLWLLGFSMQVGGGLIHALLVIAVVVFLVNVLSGRRSLG